MADKHKLAQVIRNLTSNALKFTADKGSVTISCEVDVPLRPNTFDTRLRIIFADTGVGISKVRSYITYLSISIFYRKFVDVFHIRK